MESKRVQDDTDVCYFSSPVGSQKLEASDRGLRCACFVRAPGRHRLAVRPTNPTLARAVDQLMAYFTGRRRVFDVPLDLADQPPFRRRVLETLARRVPAGRVVTYGELAALAGSPRAARAVGAAMAANPLPIFIPCHRVVARTGIGGFGPGLPSKRHLLRLEGVSCVEGEFFER